MLGLTTCNGVSWAQSTPGITFETVEPVYIHAQSHGTPLTTYSYKSVGYAVLSPDQVLEAAWIYGVKPEKVAFQAMWFYRRNDLQNIAGVESVRDAVEKLNHLQLQEAKTRHAEPMEGSGPRDSVR